MEYRMYGWGEDPDVSIPKLKELGYTAVTGGYSEKTAAACLKNGMAYHISINGFSAPAEGCTCADGTVLPGEYCPCSAESRAARLRSLRRVAALDGISGITVDYCRYPSAMGANPHFFSCFCPTCMARMAAAGLDAERIRAAVTAFMRGAASGAPFGVDAEALAAWTGWKKQVITEQFRALRDTVKSVSPGLCFGAYLFAPSAAGLVGQDYAALDGIADELSPMLYRFWPEPDGEACLDREVSGIMAMAERNPSAAAAFAACGFDVSAFPGRAYLDKNGVNVTHILSETEKARAAVQKARLIPIYLLSDRHIAHTVTCVRHLCGGIDFFVYRDGCTLLPNRG